MFFKRNFQYFLYIFLIFSIWMEQEKHHKCTFFLRLFPYFSTKIFKFFLIFLMWMEQEKHHKCTFFSRRSPYFSTETFKFSLIFSSYFQYELHKKNIINAHFFEFSVALQQKYSRFSLDFPYIFNVNETRKTSQMHNFSSTFPLLFNRNIQVFFYIFLIFSKWIEQENITNAHFFFEFPLTFQQKYSNFSLYFPYIFNVNFS